MRALRAGTAPALHAELVNVGQDELTERLENFLGQLALGEPTRPIFIEGEWGVGKSQALSIARSIAASWDLPAASICFDARSAPLSHPNRIYPIVASSLRLQGAMGLRAVLHRLLALDGSLQALSRFADQRWDAFGGALRDILRARIAGDELLLDRHESWAVILGGDLTRSDAPNKRAEAVNRLEALGGLFSACGHGGMLLLGDEVESLDQLWNCVSRAGAYNWLGALTDLTNVGWIFGATRRFSRTIASDYVSVGIRAPGRIKTTGERFLDTWNCYGFVREELRALELEDGYRFAERLGEVYRVGYCINAPAQDLQGVVHGWIADPARNPRLLARAVVEELDNLRPLSCVPPPQGLR